MNPNRVQHQAGSMLPFTAINPGNRPQPNQQVPSGRLFQFDPTTQMAESGQAAAFVVTKSDGVIAVPVGDGAIVIQGSASVENAQGQIA